MVSIVMTDLRGVKQRIGDTMSDFLVMKFTAHERSFPGYADFLGLDRRVRCRRRILLRLHFWKQHLWFLGCLSLALLTREAHGVSL